MPADQKMEEMFDFILSAKCKRVHYRIVRQTPAAKWAAQGGKMNRFVAGGLAAIAMILLAGTANAETLRVALHGQAGIDAFTPTAERIEKELGVDVEIVEYPAPDKD